METKSTKKYTNYAISLDEFEKSLNLTDEQKERINERKNYYDLLYNLRELRKKTGLSQEEVAAKSGISRSSISEIETGKINITLNTLVSLAHAMGKEVEIKFR